MIPTSEVRAEVSRIRYITYTEIAKELIIQKDTIKMWKEYEHKARHENVALIAELLEYKKAWGEKSRASESLALQYEELRKTNIHLRERIDLYLKYEHDKVKSLI